MKVITIGWAVLLAVAALVSGCNQSHTRNSSGSNWLRCETLADCSAAEDAVDCDVAGYCIDDAGERIAAPDDAGRSEVTGDGGPSQNPPPEQELCAWGVDALMEAAGTPAPGRVDCGSYGGFEEQAIRAAKDCFDRAVAMGVPVELTINECEDCSIPTTYLGTADGTFFQVVMESDGFGDDQRRASVMACDAIESSTQFIGVSCTNPVELYACSEPLSIPRTEPEPSPAPPFQLGDVPAPVGESTTPLHLYVINQSSDVPLVDIDVYLDGTHVVTGSYSNDVDTQNNPIHFDIQVPMKRLAMRAASEQGQAVLIVVDIDATAERWVVLEYLHSPDDPEGRHFTATVSDMPPVFL